MDEFNSHNSVHKLCYHHVFFTLFIVDKVVIKYIEPFVYLGRIKKGIGFLGTFQPLEVKFKLPSNPQIFSL